MIESFFSPLLCSSPIKTPFESVTGLGPDPPPLVIQKKNTIIMSVESGEPCGRCSTGGAVDVRIGVCDVGCGFVLSPAGESLARREGVGGVNEPGMESVVPLASSARPSRNTGR